MATAPDLAVAFLDRADTEARGVVELAALLSVAVLVEPELVRAIRLHVAPRIGVAAEGDLWFSPLTQDRSPGGFTFLPQVVDALQQRLRARLARSSRADPVWKVGEILERVHATSPPLIQLEERITWLAVSQGDRARPVIERELDRAVTAIEDGRAGVARWAARELPVMPREVQATGAAHRLGRVARPYVLEPIRLSAELAGTLDDTFVDPNLSEPFVDLPVLRHGDRVLIGAFDADRALGIQVPDLDPRVLAIAHGTVEETVSVPADGVVEAHVGRGAVRIRTASGSVYELPALEEERPGQDPDSRPGMLHDVVVVIPDLLGSELQRHGSTVWGFSAKAAFGLASAGGRGLSLEYDPPEVDDLGDGIAATRILSDRTVIPAVWKLEGYTKLLRFLSDTVHGVPGENLFEFPYDWRRDHRVAARILARRASEWLASWRARSGEHAKLILVAHGTGGLVARYFVEVLGGWRDTRLLVSLGTPFRGSVRALQMLTEGEKSRVFRDITDSARSWTSLYQMLPTYRCVALGDGALHRVAEVSAGSSVDPRRAADALAFHQEMDEAAARNQTEPGYLEAFRLTPVVGVAQPTLQSAVFGDGQWEFLSTLDGEDRGGDGTVPRISAVPLGREEQALYVAERHASLHRNQDVLVNLRVLVEQGVDWPRVRTGSRRGRLTITINEPIVAGDAVRIEVRADRALEEVAARIEDVESRTSLRVVTLTHVPDEEWTYRGETPPLPPATYRVIATEAKSGTSVTELFLVYPDMT